MNLRQRIAELERRNLELTMTVLILQEELLARTAGVVRDTNKKTTIN